jgi:hypothetical protein
MPPNSAFLIQRLFIGIPFLFAKLSQVRQPGYPNMHQLPKMSNFHPPPDQQKPDKWTRRAGVVAKEIVTCRTERMCGL